MTKKHVPERLARAFREGEASVALEGLDPRGTAYDRAKAMRAAGEIAWDDGAAMIAAEASAMMSKKGAA